MHKDTRELLKQVLKDWDKEREGYKLEIELLKTEIAVLKKQLREKK